MNVDGVQASRRLPAARYACAPSQREELQRRGDAGGGARPGTAGSKRRNAGVRQIGVATRMVASVRQCIRVPRTASLVSRSYAQLDCIRFSPVFTFRTIEDCTIVSGKLTR